MTSTEIPNRAAFKAAEVCTIAGLQPYVLRTWEAEFPDLGVENAGQRVYRKADVERVLRLKHLILVEGLTLAGARRKITQESGLVEPDAEAMLPGLVSAEVRKRILELRGGLQAILKMLSAEPGANGRAHGFALEAESLPSPAKPSPKAKATKAASKKR